MTRDLKKQAERLVGIALKRKEDPYQALESFLDYLLGVFELDNQKKFGLDMTKTFLDARERDEDYFLLMKDWFEAVTAEMVCGQGFLDFFGAVYEESFQGKGKATALGQFFTPDGICQMMAGMIGPQGRMSDCACGSGRTLLAAHVKADKSKFNWYEAGDIDRVSCKMCALNFMIHGMFGTVKQQNALTLETPGVIYHINEVRYPFPTEMYSIRTEYPKQ